MKKKTPQKCYSKLILKCDFQRKNDFIDILNFHIVTLYYVFSNFIFWDIDSRFNQFEVSLFMSIFDINSIWLPPARPHPQLNKKFRKHYCWAIVRPPVLLYLNYTCFSLTNTVEIKMSLLFNKYLIKYILNTIKRLTISIFIPNNGNIQWSQTALVHSSKIYFQLITIYCHERSY